jgi:tRNA-modifying protein YgfZ
MTIATALLEDRGVLRVSGEDATSFLQGLLTNDVEGCAIGEARYAALLTPQGKILFDFLVLRIPAATGTAFLIDCPAAQAADLAKRLGFYRLRARVTIADESADYGVVAAWGEDASTFAAPSVMAGLVPAIHASAAGPTSDVSGNGTAWLAGTSPAMTAEDGFSYVDPRDPLLGVRAIVPRTKASGLANAGAEAYAAHRIGLGVPSGGVDFAYADIFPHDANLDLLHGVDFKKGCYVGQEVVSRMHHRGEPRKRIVRLALGGDAPERGTPVLAGETPIGTLGSTSGRAALALLRLDRVEDANAAGKALRAGGIAVKVVAD